MCKIDDASCSVLYVYIYIYVCVRVCEYLFGVDIDFAFRLLGHPQNADENLPGIPYTYPRLDLMHYFVMIFLYVIYYVFFVYMIY